MRVKSSVHTSQLKEVTKEVMKDLHKRVLYSMEITMFKSMGRTLKFLKKLKKCKIKASQRGSQLQS